MTVATIRLFEVTPRCGCKHTYEGAETPRHGDEYDCPECGAETEHVRVVPHGERSTLADAYAATPMPTPDPVPPPPPPPAPVVPPPAPEPDPPMQEVEVGTVAGIPDRILDACSGDVEQARRVIAAIAPAVVAMSRAQREREQLRLTLEVTRTVLNRHLSLLLGELGRSAKPLMRQIEKEILDGRVAATRG